MKPTRRRRSAELSLLPPPAPPPEPTGISDDLRRRIAELARGVDKLLEAVHSLPPPRAAQERESA